MAEQDANADRTSFLHDEHPPQNPTERNPDLNSWIHHPRVKLGYILHNTRIESRGSTILGNVLPVNGPDFDYRNHVYVNCTVISAHGTFMDVPEQVAVGLVHGSDEIAIVNLESRVALTRSLQSVDGMTAKISNGLTHNTGKPHVPEESTADDTLTNTRDIIPAVMEHREK